MLGFVPLSKKIQLLFGGELDKIFITLLSGHQDTFLDEMTFKKLLEILNNPQKKYTRKDIFDNFLGHVDKRLDWPKAIRTSLVLHKVIHNSSEDLPQLFSSKKLSQISGFRAPEGHSKQSGHHMIVVPYFNYLQKLAHCYNDLSVCFNCELDTFENFLQKNSLSFLHFLSKVQNMLRYLVKIFPHFESSMYEFKAPLAVKQALYFCLTDSFHFYTFMNQAIDPMLKEIFSLSPEDAIFLFELYCEHVTITNRLKSIFALKNLLHEFYLEVPEFYAVNPTFNNEIELYVIGLKKGDDKDRKCSVFNLIPVNIEVQRALGDALNNAESHNDIESGHVDEYELGPKSFKSLQEVSKTLLGGIRGLTSLPENGEKNYYKAPKNYMRKNGPTNQPKIKVIKPKKNFFHKDSNSPGVANSNSMEEKKKNNFLQVPSDYDFPVNLCPNYEDLNCQQEANGNNSSLNTSDEPGKPKSVLEIPSFCPKPSLSLKNHCRSISISHNLDESFPERVYAGKDYCFE